MFLTTSTTILGNLFANLAKYHQQTNQAVGNGLVQLRLVAELDRNNQIDVMFGIRKDFLNFQKILLVCVIIFYFNYQDLCNIALRSTHIFKLSKITVLIKNRIPPYSKKYTLYKLGFFARSMNRIKRMLSKSLNPLTVMFSISIDRSSYIWSFWKDCICTKIILQLFVTKSESSKRRHFNNSSNSQVFPFQRFSKME